MASDAAPAATYACRCLNVRIVAATSSVPPPDYPRDAQYTPVFVNDDGLSVTHPQVTVRINSKGVPIPGTSRCSRFTAVLCLFCSLPVYRVHQTISLDVEGNESTLLPTEEWVEREVLKTATGWVDVHKDCIVGDGIANAQVSSSYVPIFNLLLPSDTSTPASPKMDKVEDVEIPLKDNASPETPAPSYLADIRALFLPPPFTSSHPIFVRLAAIATKESQELRAAAEQRISDFVKAETAGVEMKERDIKRQVEVLWTEFRQHLASVQRTSVNDARSPSRGKEATSSGLLSPTAVSSSMAVRNFVPVPVSLGEIPAASSSVPRRSALSESMATSTFHHPKEKRKQSSSTRETSNGYDSDRSQTLSTRSDSSTLVHPVHQVDGPNILQLPRNVNDTINTQASYRYFVNLEEDIARHKRQQEGPTKKHDAPPAQRDQEAGPSQAPLSPNTNGKKTQRRVQIDEPQPSAGGEAKAEDKDVPSRGPDKGKRKVTFDVQPAVVTINGKDNKEEDEEAATEDPREMIFELEDLENASVAPSAGQTTLPLLDQPAGRPARAKKVRTQTNTAIEAFNTLRPSSLPNPSHIRPLRSQPGVDSSSQGMMLALPRVSAASTSRDKGTPVASSSQTPLNEQDAELLKLVAADTPSHRGAWTPDSKAWQTFTRRQEAKGDAEIGKLLEEGEEGEASSTLAPLKVARGKGRKALDISEDDDDLYEQSRNCGIAASLPVEIVKRVKPREQLSLASYRPQAAVGPGREEQASAPAPAPSSSHSNKNLSASAIRKVAYAERDRLRSMDPGALDFATEPDELEDEGEDKETEDAGEKARKQALRILQARSELPEEGMWRSLAS